jgi:SAM-dependent methyltransferase
MGQNNKEVIEDFYSSDTYFTYNSHIEEDSVWKIQKLIPLVDCLLAREQSLKLQILDVGGGSGLILKSIATYISNHHSREVVQLAMDLSPGFLDLQRKNNPRLSRAIHGSIESTPFADKELDIVLLMDVLEHLHSPDKCLEEVNRIAKYALLKVPLEKNLSMDLLELLFKYRTKRAGADGVGHINFYRYSTLKREIEINLGAVLRASYTDVFSYLLSSPKRRERLPLSRVLYCFMAKYCYRISPSITAKIFNDFIVLLVKCHNGPA